MDVRGRNQPVEARSVGGPRERIRAIRSSRRLTYANHTVPSPPKAGHVYCNPLSRTSSTTKSIAPSEARDGWA